MAIAKMSEFTLFAFAREREELLEELQAFEDVHFSDFSEEEIGELKLSDASTDLQEISEEMARLSNAIDILKSYDKRKPTTPEYSMEEIKTEGRELETSLLYRELMNLVSKKDALRQEITSMKNSISEMNAWKRMDAELSELGEKRDTVRWIGSLPTAFRENFLRQAADTEGLYVEPISDSDGISRFFVMYLKEAEEAVSELLRQYGFVKVGLEGQKTPADETVYLKSELSMKEAEMSSVERDIANLLPELDEFKMKYEFLANEKVKREATARFMETESVNILKGYVPAERRSEFEAVVKKALGDSFYLEVEDAKKEDEQVPIILKNNKLVQCFEGLTTMYSLPKYSEVDPTPLLAPFYWFFFGMMAADIGYGFLLSLGAFILLKTGKLSKGMAENVKFFGLLGIPTMIWGVLYASFFGGLIPMPWTPVFDTNKDFIALLVASVAFGLIHLFFALGIKAYMNIRDGHPLDALYDVVFWYMALVGAILLLAGGSLGLSATAMTISKVVMIVGMAGIVLFGARDADSLFGRLAGGLYSLYGISSYVGDFVSYSRLMALGLSGGFIGFAVNTICRMLWKGPVGIVAAIVVFLVFHLFNMFLSFLSAYVHSARLTYVEFFGKFYEGGGSAFQKFRSNPKYINMKE